MLLNKFELTGKFKNQLLKASSTLPDIKLNNGFLDRATFEFYKQTIINFESHDLIKLFKALLSNNKNSKGYIVVDCNKLFNDLEFNQKINVLTAICSMVSRPVQVFDRWDLWKELGVTFDVAPYRARGTGHNPLHIDVANATYPPNYSVLFCYRPDPFGDGCSIVSNLQKAVDQLDKAEIEVLAKSKFYEGSFYNLTGVGKAINPFPVIEKKEQKLWQVRFSAKMIPNMKDCIEKEIMIKLEKIVIDNQEKFFLDKNQILIMNQKIICHGRESLDDKKQRRLRLDERRLIFQSFLIE